jgi:hypothetical protein
VSTPGKLIATLISKWFAFDLFAELSDKVVVPSISNNVSITDIFYNSPFFAEFNQPINKKQIYHQQ